jgi:hypothetical protein
VVEWCDRRRWCYGLLFFSEFTFFKRLLSNVKRVLSIGIEKFFAKYAALSEFITINQIQYKTPQLYTIERSRDETMEQIV